MKKQCHEKRRHKWWIKDILKKRKQHGVFHHLVKELGESDVDFKAFFRMDKAQFRDILMNIEKVIAKTSLTREAISARERLAICLRLVFVEFTQKLNSHGEGSMHLGINF